MDGYEATRRIKSLPGLGGVTIVAISGIVRPFRLSTRHWRQAVSNALVELIDFPAVDSLGGEVLTLSEAPTMLLPR